MMGNSYTYQQNVGGQLQLLLRSRNGISTDSTVTTLASGGLKLYQHRDKSNDVNSAWYTNLQPNQDFDFVVLQDQSIVPTLDSSGSYSWEYDLSRNAAVELDTKISAMGAKTIFFQTWGRRYGMGSDFGGVNPTYLAMQQNLEDGYDDYADAIHAQNDGRIAYMGPVGQAFKHLHDTDFPLFESLYRADDSHVNSRGSYIAACVLFSSITGQPCTGSPTSYGFNDDLLLSLQTAADHASLTARLQKYPLPLSSPNPSTTLNTTPDTAQSLPLTTTSLSTPGIPESQTLTTVAQTTTQASQTSTSTSTSEASQMVSTSTSIATTQERQTSTSTSTTTQASQTSTSTSTTLQATKTSTTSSTSTLVEEGPRYGLQASCDLSTFDDNAFNICLDLKGQTTGPEPWMEHFAAARKFWESVILNDEGGPWYISPELQAKIPKATEVPENLDDVYIAGIATTIDGPGKVLGAAGPMMVIEQQLNPLNGIPFERTVTGFMRFDIADIEDRIEDGTFGTIIKVNAVRD